MRQILAVLVFSTFVSGCGAHSYGTSPGTAFWVGWQSLIGSLPEWERPVTNCQHHHCCQYDSWHTKRCRQHHIHPGPIYPRI